jgi:hypothetical protein
MTLTVVVGSSGSGKTTFLNDVHKSHKCTYIRQHHNIRPYVVVSKIPNFDPKGLPYWDIYEREGKAGIIRVGGTMGGDFTAGLSGGQRKLLLFELIIQRVKSQKDLLICLDEPFAGVTDDFVPFIVKRLEELRENHNIVLVTNDHVDTLTVMADNTITVSAIDRTTVQINEVEKTDRQKAILALCVGGTYAFKTSMEDLKFFVDVEILNGALMGVVPFTICAFSLFLVCFWNSDQDNAPLLVLGANEIAFFCLQPYLYSLVDWRDYMNEEAEALVHASKSMNTFLKTSLTLTMVLVISILEFAVVNADISGLESVSFWVGMLMDSVSLTFPFICLGLYTGLPFQTFAVLAGVPHMLMLFFSTTFSPGSGVEGVKELRYLFPRFYLWCMIPQVEDSMENCPSTDMANLLYCVLSALVAVVTFVIVMVILKTISARKEGKKSIKRAALRVRPSFRQLQLVFYGKDSKTGDQSMSSSTTSDYSRQPTTIGNFLRERFSI